MNARKLHIQKRWQEAKRLSKKLDPFDPGTQSLLRMSSEKKKMKAILLTGMIH